MPDYPICPTCGAVDYGNATCRTCALEWQARGSNVDALLAAIGDRPPEPPAGPDEVRRLIERVAEARASDDAVAATVPGACGHG